MSLMVGTVQMQCDQCYLWVETRVFNITDARKVLKPQGWKAKPPKDYCPDCVELQKQGIFEEPEYRRAPMSATEEREADEKENRSSGNWVHDSDMEDRS